MGFRSICSYEPIGPYEGINYPSWVEIVEDEQVICDFDWLHILDLSNAYFW